MNDDSRASVVYHHVARLVSRGSSGDALPSTRTLSKELSASPVTIGRAIAQLAAEGLVQTEPGRGTFVAGRRRIRIQDVAWQPLALPPARVDPGSVRSLDPAAGGGTSLPLSSGYLAAELQPRVALSAAASRVLRRADVWQPAPSSGLSGLRALFAAEIGLDADEVVVTCGSQSALTLVLRSLTSPGDAIVVENPTYPGALAAMRASGLRPYPAPTDRDGVRPDDLDTALGRSGARMVYLQSGVSNPSGATLSPERRRETLAVAARHSVLLIDDDWARHLQLDRTPLRPLIADDTQGRVISLSSLAKPVAPSLRVGYLAARGPALSRLRTSAITDQLFVARPLQETAQELLASPEWPRHQARLRRQLTVRRDHLLENLARDWPADEPTIRPTAGLHLWVPCPPGWTSDALVNRASELGIVIGDGSHAYADEPPSQRVRMSFGALSEASAASAVRKIVDAL